MQKIFLVLALSVSVAGIFISCKKEKSCEGCRENNRPPNAIAGPDQVITLPTDSILLDGSASNDPDGTISEWRWTKVAGPASFNIVTAVSAKTKVKNLVAGTYKFELSVRDNNNESAKDTMTVTVDASPTSNHPPVANGGNDTTITLPANAVNLDGSRSTDPDNNITSYQWTKIEGPSSFSIVNANSVTTQVTNLTGGVYQFELKVTDAGGLSSKDTMQVMVSLGPPMNRPPVANAGLDQTVILPTNTITLNGNASTDPDNNIIGYTWTKTSGPSTFSITNTNALQTQVTNLVEGIYKFELKVTDAGGLYSKDTMQVTVNALPPTEINRDIFVAGYETNGSNIRVAKYWENGVAVPLTDGMKDATATSITVVGSDVYVAGYETNGGNIRVAKYWKNGVAVPLTDGTKDAGATSITVVGSDVYVAGYETNGGNSSLAKYWKNGIALTLSSGINSARANDIAIMGSDVYVAGYESNGSQNIAKYWKNGVGFSLTAGTISSVANSIAVGGSDVYVAGSEDNGNIQVVKYWKNGIAVSLNRGENASATSIAVVGGNICVAGFNDSPGPDIAKYWENGQEFALSDRQHSAFAMDIAVAGSDVYVAGSECSWDWVGNHWNANVAKYWKNGVAVPLTDGTKSAFAHSIAVVQR